MRYFYDQNYDETDISWIVEIGEYHSWVGYNIDRITEIDQGMIRTIGVIL